VAWLNWLMDTNQLFFLLDLQGQYRYKQTIENHVRIRIQ
jgi:hypothetical protein